MTYKKEFFEKAIKLINSQPLSNLEPLGQIQNLEYSEEDISALLTNHLLEPETRQALDDQLCIIQLALKEVKFKKNFYADLVRT